MNKIILASALLAMILLISSNVMAVSVTADSNVSINGKEDSFSIQITNDAYYARDLLVKLYTPAEYHVTAPISVPANSTITATITVTNPYAEYTKTYSKLEVYLGKELSENDIILEFDPSAENSSASNNSSIAGLFGLESFNSETTSFSLLDWALFWILTIIAAVLLVAFIARVVKRA